MKSMEPLSRFAVVNDIYTNRKIVAICEWETFDVWGNAREGYAVNQSFSQGQIEIPAVVVISNMPRIPGAFDRYRSFSKEDNSFSCEMSISFHIEDEALKKALGITCQIEVDGDGECYTIDRAKDDFPIATVRIIGWKDENGYGPEPSADLVPV